MPEAAAAAERRFLTFRSAGRHYALPAEEVTEVIPMPPVARLPQSPASLLGLANLRGAVIPVASLRALLRQPAAAPGARAILLGGAAPVAIAVDQVDALVSLDASRLDNAPSALTEEPGERLRGVFQHSEGAEATRILDIAALIEGSFTPARRSGTAAKARHAAASAAPSAMARLVSFDIAGQDYALPLGEVQEIVALPAIAPVPRSEALLLGLAFHRGATLPLLSLRGLLGFPVPEVQPDTAKLVVTRIGGVAAGLVVDQAKAVIAAPEDDIEPAPAMLAARMGGEARIRAIYRGPQGIVSILAVERLFGEEVMARLSRLSEANPQQTAETYNAALRQFLVFRLGEEEFALPIAAVNEVAAMPEKITRVPKTPKFLEGVINLRGEVLPVIDQRRRFDLPVDEAIRPRLLVVRSVAHAAGLLVDGISGIVAAAEDEIEPAPLLSGEQVRMVDSVLNLPASGRMILLLNPDELLSRTERGLLDAFARKPGD